MAADTFSPVTTGGSSKYGYITSGISPAQQNPFESATSKFSSDKSNLRMDPLNGYAIMIRKLAHSTSKDQLESMLIFAQDMISVDFVSDKDKGYKTAIARFSNASAAQSARDMLNGKPNTSRETNMIVDVVQVSPGGAIQPIRGTIEQRDTNGVDSTGFPSGAQLGRQSSKFNGTFQALDRVSPPRISSFGNGEVSKQDGSVPYQGIFSPTSPIGHPLERQRVSGKSVIGEDVDDETGKLLNDPIGYAQNNGGSSMRPSNGHQQSARRSTLPHLPVSAFQNLNLNNTGMTSPPISGMTSPRSGGIMQHSGPYSPSNMASMGPNASYQFSNQHYMRPNFPPINPSDQNPPCNTLYVGNLPMDTSEDELKQMFIKQRGYKRLCFRTKANGPMCFVEFEDIQTASKALTECYGLPLHNSTKGGIRLSFSKNPLGVRGGQPGGALNSPISPSNALGGVIGGGGGQPGSGGPGGNGGMSGTGLNGYTNALGQAYSTVSGPPPGLPAPPGLPGLAGLNISPNGIASPGSGIGMNGLGSPNGFSSPISPVGTGLGGGISGIGSLRSPTITGMGLGSGHAGGWPSSMAGMGAGMGIGGSQAAVAAAAAAAAGGHGSAGNGGNVPDYMLGR